MDITFLLDFCDYRKLLGIHIGLDPFPGQSHLTQLKARSPRFSKQHSRKKITLLLTRNMS